MSLYESWLFPVLEVAHLVGMVLLIGAVGFENWRIWNREPLTREPLFWWGALAQAATGPLLLLANVPRYTANSAFHAKMAILAVAIAAELIVKPRWPGRFTAALSFALWTAIIIAARLIADFDAY